MKKKSCGYMLKLMYLHGLYYGCKLYVANIIIHDLLILHVALIMHVT